MYFENINNIVFFVKSYFYRIYIFTIEIVKIKRLKFYINLYFIIRNVILFVFLSACFSILKYLLLILNAYYY